MTRTRKALVIALIVLSVACSYVSGRVEGHHDYTPPAIHQTPGFNCWQEWNVQQPHHHEEICQAYRRTGN